MRDSPFCQQLIEEGMQIQARKGVLRVLRLRFGDEAVSEFEAAVNGLENIEQLEALHAFAIQSRRISQFRKAMPKPQRSNS